MARVLPLGDPPRNAAEVEYYRSAVDMRHYINDHPVPALLTRLFVYRVSVSDLREVARSCDGGSSADIPQYTDVVATVTDHTVFGFPLGRYTASCAGNAIARGRPDYRSPAPAPGRLGGNDLPPSATASQRSPPTAGAIPSPAPAGRSALPTEDARE